MRMAHCKKKKKKKKKKNLKYLLIAKVIVPTSRPEHRASRRGVQGPAEGPLVGIEGAKPPEAAGF